MALTPVSLRGGDRRQQREKDMKGIVKPLLDGATDAPIANFQPLFNGLSVVVHCQRLFDVQCCQRYQWSTQEPL